MSEHTFMVGDAGILVTEPAQTAAVRIVFIYEGDY